MAEHTTVQAARPTAEAQARTPDTTIAERTRAATKQHINGPKYVYRLTRRHTDGTMDTIGSYDRLIGDFARPSSARLAGDRHEGDMGGRPLRVWNASPDTGYWWRYSRLGLYLYEVRRLVANPPGEE